MSAARVLVTGAAGFIGSHVADHCLAQRMEVVATDDLSGGFRSNVPKECKFIQGDLRDPEFVSSLWNGDSFDYVYHLGAYAAEGLSHFIRRYNYETNLVASINLINESVKHQVKCFVFTSSIAVYGPNQVPMDLRAAHAMFGLNYIIFRPHNVYGERQNIADKYRNVIGIFMNQLLQGDSMSVFGDGLQTRAFSHVDDVAPLIARSPLVGGAINETFNVGADTPYTILELARETAAAMGKPCNIKTLERRNEVVHAFS
ncbi:MAG: NAD-dependent epimerase/dehydratase family protein, partial [Armatimonadota bacterium]|nr:NAD-dependent epimerase/dehydratase family protein [Armatimonadota bacterium]